MSSVYEWISSAFTGETPDVGEGSIFSGESSAEARRKRRSKVTIPNTSASAPIKPSKTNNPPKTGQIDLRAAEKAFPGSTGVGRKQKTAPPKKETDPVSDVAKKAFARGSEPDPVVDDTLSKTVEELGKAPQVDSEKNLRDLQEMFSAIGKGGSDTDPLIVGAMANVDLSPFWNWYDNTFGTNFRKGYKAPPSPLKMMERLQKSSKTSDEFRAKMLFGIAKEKNRVQGENARLQNARDIANRKLKATGDKAIEKLDKHSRDMVSTIATIRGQADNVAKLMDSSMTGLKGWALGYLGSFGKGNIGGEKQLAVKQTLRNMMGMFAHLFGGKALTEHEMATFKPLFPEVGDSKGLLMYKSTNFPKQINNLMRTRGRAAGIPSSAIKVPFPEADKMDPTKYLRGEDA